ncbi:hypothetical protein VPH35_012676 [Triticum aestivum]
MTAEEEAWLMQCVMEDSMNMHDERQWKGLEEMMALSATGDVAIPELEMQWSWSCMAPEMADAVGGVNWCPTWPRSQEREAPPREEVVQAPPAFQPAPVCHAPPSHLWTPPDYVEFVSDDDDNGGH